jgi:hypothetical protein
MHTTAPIKVVNKYWHAAAALVFVQIDADAKCTWGMSSRELY